MEVTLGDVLTVAGMFITIILGFWASYRALNRRIDSVQQETDLKIRECHQRINDFREDFVHKDHINESFQAVRQAISELGTNLTTSIKGTNDRIDRLLEMWSSGRVDDNERRRD